MPSDDKRFDATAGRLARAKREGDLPRSHDISVVASLGAAGAFAFVAIWPLGAAARLALAQAAHPGEYSPLPYVAIAGYALAVIATGLIASVAASYVQAGGFTLKFPVPKFEKLNPGPGLGRMFGRDAAFGGMRALVSATAVLFAAVVPVRDTFGAARGGASPEALASLVVHALEGALAGALAVALVFAIVDMLPGRRK